jgi:pilus assembly protein Flp/PilA
MKNFFKDESGQGMVEYGLIIALVAIVVVSLMTPAPTKEITDIFDECNKK